MVQEFAIQYRQGSSRQVTPKNGCGRVVAFLWHFPIQVLYIVCTFHTHVHAHIFQIHVHTCSYAVHHSSSLYVHGTYMSVHGSCLFILYNVCTWFISVHPGSPVSFPVGMLFVPHLHSAVPALDNAMVQELAVWYRHS